MYKEALAERRCHVSVAFAGSLAMGRVALHGGDPVSLLIIRRLKNAFDAGGLIAFRELLQVNLRSR
jgi:hypothetical protein